MDNRFNKPLAFGITVIAHLSLALWMLWAAKHPAIIPPEQLITVEMIPPPMAAPSAPKEKPVKKAEKKPAVKAAEVAEATEKPSPPQAIAQATATHAIAPEEAITTPVFDAAYLHNPAPAYPPAARKRHVEGTVLLEVSVSPQGTAESVTLHTSSNSPLLDEAARKAVAAWQFIPAKRNGTAISATVIVPVIFTLGD